MPDWSNEVPKDPRGVALPIRRTPPHAPLCAIVTSTDIVGTMTHYWKSRTMPHEKVNCGACDAGIPYRWHSYMSAWERKTAMHFLFEVTAQAAEHFVTYRLAHGTLRGCAFRASRWRQNPNGRVLIETKPADIVEYPVPKGPDLIAVLSILWNLPASDVHHDVGAKHEETKVVDLIAERSQYSEPPADEKSNGRKPCAGQTEFE